MPQFNTLAAFQGNALLRVHSCAAAEDRGAETQAKQAYRQRDSHDKLSHPPNERYLRRISLYSLLSWKQRQIVDLTGLLIAISTAEGDPKRERGVAGVFYIPHRYQERAACYRL